jgi:molybdate transport system ATP-binding protein
MLELSASQTLGSFRLAAELRAETAGVTALFGPSGAGKTTILNWIAGLTRPDAGHIRLDDTVLFDSARGIDLKPERRRIGYVFQDGRLFPHLDLMGNLLYGYRRLAVEARRLHPDAIIDLLDLGRLVGRGVFTLSGGERQRVALGRALLTSPHLLLLDEPLAGLDARRKAEILPFLERLNRQLRLPTIFVSHDLDEVLRLSEQIAIIDAGRIVAQGPIAEVFARLDLPPHLAGAELGAVLEATVERVEHEAGVTRLAFAGRSLTIAGGLNRQTGDRVLLRVKARDVALARSEPLGISILNRLPARIVRIIEAPSNATEFADLLLDAGQPLWARITRYSLNQLDLKPGDQVWALVKAAALAAQD